jgi:hypothetical protein
LELLELVRLENADEEGVCGGNGGGGAGGKGLFANMAVRALAVTRCVDLNTDGVSFVLEDANDDFSLVE